MLWLCRYSVLVGVSVCLGGGPVVPVSGCTRGIGPAGWLDSVAPRVSLSSQRLVTLSWRQDMLLSDPGCRQRWQILVEKEGEQREVCSGTTSPRENDYICTLDLSPRQYCGHQFSFSLRVLAQQDRGKQWLSSPRKSLLQLQCGGLSSVTSVLAPPQQGNCAGYKPVWRLEPLFYRVDPINYRIEWNKRHIDNINCVADFLLQIWDVDTQRVVINTKFDGDLYGENFYKTIPVQPCKEYRYRLTAISVARTNLEVEGSFRTRCEADREDREDSAREGGRIRELQRSLEWNPLPFTSQARQQGSFPSLALLLALGLTLVLEN